MSWQSFLRLARGANHKRRHVARLQTMRLQAEQLETRWVPSVVGPSYEVGVMEAGPLQAGSGFMVEIQAIDASGNPVTNYTGPATVNATLNPSSAGAVYLPSPVPINGSGMGCFVVSSVQQAGTYTISVADSTGTLTGSSAPVTVTPGPVAKLAFETQPVSTATGVTLAPLTVAVTDLYGNVVSNDNTDNVTVGIASGPGTFMPGSTTTAPVVNGVATFNNLTLATPGNYTLSEVVPAQYMGPASSSFSVVPLQVVPGSFAGTPSGFSVQLNAPILVNSVTPALYGRGAGATATVTPTVTLTQRTGVPPAGVTLPYNVAGSLIVDKATNTLTFVETDTTSVVDSGIPLLPDGTYVVDISSSGVNGLQALNRGGCYLDGTNSGTPGHAFTATFAVTAAADGDDVLWVPPTADGPGQALNAPGMNQIGGGYPVYLSDSTGTVTDVQATLTYNPALLIVTPTSTSTFTVTVPFPGTALLQYTGPDLASGIRTPIGYITASVPSGTDSNPVPLRANDLLQLSAVSVNNGAVPVVTSDGLHLVNYVGDVDGDALYESYSSTLITRVLLDTDTGFAPFPLVDPIIVADTDGSGFIPADAALQSAQASVGLKTANLAVPPIPSGVVFMSIGNSAAAAIHPEDVRSTVSVGSGEKAAASLATSSVIVSTSPPVPAFVAVIATNTLSGNAPFLTGLPLTDVMVQALPRGMASMRLAGQELPPTMAYQDALTWGVPVKAFGGGGAGDKAAPAAPNGSQNVGATPTTPPLGALQTALDQYFAQCLEDIDLEMINA